MISHVNLITKDYFSLLMVIVASAPIVGWVLWQPLTKRAFRRPDMEDFFRKSGLYKTREVAKAAKTIDIFPRWRFQWGWTGRRIVADGIIINTKGFSVDLSDGSPWFGENRGRLQNAADLKLANLPNIKGDKIIWPRSQFYDSGGKKNGS